MAIGMVVQGRQIRAGDLEWLREWIAAHPQWSRKRIARELCQRWAWVDGRGRLKDFAARSFLLKLAALGRVRLPELQAHMRRAMRRVPSWPDWQEPPAWTASLPEISPVRVERIEAGSPAAQRWRFYLERYHYLGWRVVGEHQGYLAVDRQGRDVGCLLFGAAAWRCVRPGIGSWAGEGPPGRANWDGWSTTPGF